MNVTQTISIDTGVNEKLPRRNQILDGLENTLNKCSTDVEGNQYQRSLNTTLELVSSLINDDSPPPCADRDEEGNVYLNFWGNYQGVTFTIFTDGQIQGVIENENDGIVVERTLTVSWRENDELFEFRKTIDDMIQVQSDEFSDLFI